MFWAIRQARSSRLVIWLPGKGLFISAWLNLPPSWTRPFSRIPGAWPSNYGQIEPRKKEPRNPFYYFGSNMKATHGTYQYTWLYFGPGNQRGRIRGAVNRCYPRGR